MMQAIGAEYEFMRTQFNTPWQSVYFGGGTPSIIPADEIAIFLNLVKQNGGIAFNAEITLEANPEDINRQSLQTWKDAGINRLSIGIQSLNDDELRMMNRAHSRETALASVELALAEGYKSVNIDLIFGSPWLSEAQWQSHLDWAFGCGADHISAYALTVEPKTRLKKQIDRNEIPSPIDENQSKQYHMLSDKAEQSGWDFYEISNLSKPGQKATHNSNYWNNLPYLGLGPSAHSYDGKAQRWWNVNDNSAYIAALNNNEWPRESEILSANQQFNEWLMTHIRMAEGLDLDIILNSGFIPENEVKKLVQQGIRNGWMVEKDKHLILTTEGRLFADHITTLWMI